MEKELEKKLIKKILLSPIMIGVFVLVLFSCVGASYAATTIFSSSEVGFDNTRTNIQSTNVQGAIDELYTKATDYSGINTRVNELEETIGNSELTTTDQTLIGGINEINSKAMIHPIGYDFDNKVSVTSTYQTADKDGFVFASINAASTGYYYVKIDGYEFFLNDSSSSSGTSIIIPIFKGQRYSFSIKSAGEAYYIPYKYAS